MAEVIAAADALAPAPALAPAAVEQDAVRRTRLQVRSYDTRYQFMNTSVYELCYAFKLN